ncbi:MAG: hypothetical protein ACRD19_04720 [Terriglobia bacterium]
MLRRVAVIAILGCLFAANGWAKVNKDDKEYFDEQIAAVTAQMQAIEKQITGLTAQLRTLTQQFSDMQKAQADFHETLQHQGESLNDMLTSMNIMRQSHSTDMGSIADRLNVLTSQVNGLLASERANTSVQPSVVPAVTAGVAPVASATAPPVAAAAGVEGYIVAVNGTDLTVGLGSGQGLQVGSKLGLFKKADPQVRVGELEVTSIMDSSNCHARILALNDGVQPGDDDIVRPEQP